MANQYLHILCENYSLLTDIQHVEQVISGQWNSEQTQLTWQGKTLACVNLLHLFTGNAALLSRHCIIMKKPDSDETTAVLVGRVTNVQVIQESEFDDLPNLDFPFNDYFDKVYIQKTDKRCIYRLKSLFAIGKS